MPTRPTVAGSAGRGIRANLLEVLLTFRFADALTLFALRVESIALRDTVLAAGYCDIAVCGGTGRGSINRLFQKGHLATGYGDEQRRRKQER